MSRYDSLFPFGTIAAVIAVLGAVLLAQAVPTTAMNPMESPIYERPLPDGRHVLDRSCSTFGWSSSFAPPGSFTPPGRTSSFYPTLVGLRAS